ncbi:MAG: Peptidoglycan hydrolase FlgJ [Candidatus Celerinatantimonas neptuna]|nr:MAG: Peptidoglycan hydrolase FlgJ [Candidatus Celerinatantimonas neptuna]
MDLNTQLIGSTSVPENYNDLSQLNVLRQEAEKHPHKALKKVARQFEAIFMQMLLKEMRKANNAFESPDSPMNNRYVKNYQQMYDKQLALDLSNNGSLGLSKLIVQQFAPDVANITPASQLRAYGRANQFHLKPSHNIKKSLQELHPESVGKKVADKKMLTMDVRRFYGDNVQKGPVTRAAPATKRQQFASEQAFIQKVLPLAKKIAAPAGIAPIAVVAQAALETGWGSRVIAHGNGASTHNLFGIKAGQRWQGDKARVKTLEYEQGIAQPKHENFRSYSSFDDSVKDYVALLHHPRYQQALENGHDPVKFAQALQKAGYATDPRYADKIKQILDSGVLNKFSD